MMEIDDRILSFDFEKNFEMDINASDDGPVVPGTEICKYFLKGTCTKGNNCQYKHTTTDKEVVCKHWLRGLCKKGDNCEFLHEYDLSKMPECYFYTKYGKVKTIMSNFLSIVNNKGECSNPECMYLHIRPEDKMKDCLWFARGFCKHGRNIKRGSLFVCLSNSSKDHVVNIST